MEFDSQVERNEAGRSLGHDLYRYGRHLHDHRVDAPVGEGFALARATHVDRRAPDRYVRKWLQLRINAYRRNRIVDHSVTPGLLQRIDVAECPVLRIALTHGHCSDSDWSIDRLNNDGAYARSNLGVMSTFANKAKGAKSFGEVLGLASADADAEGLTPRQWLRIASLMVGPTFAENPGIAPLVPLVAPLPPCTVRPAFQIVQSLFTTRAGTHSGKNALIRYFKCTCMDERSLNALLRFAEAIHQELKIAKPCWDVWLRDRVVTAFSAWRCSLRSEQWGRAGHIAGQLIQATRVESTRLQTWHVASRGYFH